MSIFPKMVTVKAEKPDIWEEVGEHTDVYRTPTPGGWLIMVNTDGGGITFVPDTTHEWTLE